MNRGPSPRCACGRARRKTAEHCQKCLDALEAARAAAEPPRKLASEWRREGWLVVTHAGSILLAPIGADGIEIRAVRTTYIDGGRWARFLDPKRAPWRPLTPLECVQIGPKLRAIQAACYCHAFPRTGCDFCNGIRKPASSGVAAYR